MGAPLPVSNLITSGPFAQNEGLVIPAGTSLWQPSTTAATKAHNSTGTPSIITVSPYDASEGLTFPEGTPFWQSKDWAVINTTSAFHLAHLFLWHSEFSLFVN
jgi:hypothetical protein